MMLTMVQYRYYSTICTPKGGKYWGTRTLYPKMERSEIYNSNEVIRNRPEDWPIK